MGAVKTDKWRRVRDFFNKPKDVVFNDSLLASMLVEMRLKNYEFNELLELPCKNGKYCAIRDKVPADILTLIHELVSLGNSKRFITYTKAKLWLCDDIGIALYNLSSLPLTDDNDYPVELKKFKAKTMWNEYSV